ncbi:pyridoxal phosphate-dependent transferase [Talaromyces proteolyticus]|uniref:Pyridoxal phosphate-dependent transferase n=1 Tax=Talaromyces proteolyticus TaxID=1131652 RepID=A0AAD4PXP9_9EURO|nr:pyridoxal phosphate-dependent transferase [Talaromyces proteolyticus]KAH8700295.1 pyridoxal phosphate-dependent transferase [Talaromyces proteolyticus]
MNGHSEISKMQSDAMSSSVLYPKLDRKQLLITGSKGLMLIAEDGTRIIDATGGAAVACLGHNNDQVKEAIIKQLEQITYCYSQFFTTPPLEKLTQHLTESTNGEMSKVFVVSSGTEAVEAALKMARQYFTELPQPQYQRHRIIARRQSYHGNTLGSLAVGSHKARRALYEPMLNTQISHVSPCYPYREKIKGESDFDYVERLAQELEDEFQRVGPDTVCAFIAETVCGGTLGCVPPVSGYFKAMREVCDRHGALLILDEVMTGMGRTGTYHAWEQEGVIPDLQTIAKCLGGGYAPIGALLVNRRVVDILNQGTKVYSHSQTYQGHALACATALEVQNIIKNENLVANVAALGPYLGQLLQKELGDHPNIGDIRGRGLFWGIEFVQDKSTKEPFPVQKQLAGNIHLAGTRKPYCISLLPGNGTADGKNGDHIILAPPYTVTKQELEEIVRRAKMVIFDVLKSID